MKPFASTFYKSFFDNMIDGLAYCRMIFDTQGNPVDFIYIKTNKNYDRLTGLTDVTGKRVTEIIPGIRISNPELFEIYGRVAMTGEPQQFEIYVKQLSRWFFVSVYSPKKTFFVAVFQNITARKRIEQDLEDARIAARNVLDDFGIEKSKVDMARAKEEAILLSIGDGLLATDEVGNITLVNRAAENLLGRKSREVIGKVFSNSISMEDDKGASILFEKHPISMALASGTVTTTSTAGPSYYYVRKDGTKFPVAIMVTPIVFERRVIGAIEVFRDITVEKEIDKAKSEFVSLASHQLRTPLTAVSWYTEMILSGDVGEVLPNQKKYLEEISRGNQRMIELVNTLLNVSRIELGTFKVESKPTDIIAVAESVLDELKPKIAEKGLNIIRAFSVASPAILADPDLLHMVFQNLLSNAAEYTPAGGTVDFSLDLDPKGAIIIRISDTGYGIPKDQHSRIFTKFFRADNVRNKDTHGTGLGLYIVKSTVENCGGKIWFESPSPKRIAGQISPGTDFHVTIPLTKQQN